MRILVCGAGAIGTFIGGSLALSTGANPKGKLLHQVVFLERPEVITELRQNGLHLRMNGTENRFPHPQVASNLAEALQLGPFDIAIFALKSNDTLAALEILAPYKTQLPPFLCIQNGVDNEPALAAALGPDKVIAGSVTSSIARRAIGDIVIERRRGIGIAGPRSISLALIDALNGAKLNAHLYPRAADMKWSKLMTNLLANATSAILDMTPGEVFAHPGLFAMEVQQQLEVLRVMNAQGIHVTNLPGVPVWLLAFGVLRLPPVLARPILQRAVGSGRGAKMPSFHIDLYNGRGRSEVEYLNGAVVRYGERLKIPTPVSRLLTETLISLTTGKLPRDTYARQPEKLLKELEHYPPIPSFPFP